MNWDKAQKEGRMRRQGTVRALTEDAERRLKALRERKRHKGYTDEIVPQRGGAAGEDGTARASAMFVRRYPQDWPACD
jgi:hypothetical protein